VVVPEGPEVFAKKEIVPLVGFFSSFEKMLDRELVKIRTVKQVFARREASGHHDFAFGSLG
jgi:hypothetical protein